MPLSIFLGRPTPKPGEPLWLDGDQDTAVAFMLWSERDKAERCQRCGTKEADWVDPVSGKELRDPKWRAVVRRCVGCGELQEVESEDVDDGRPRDGRYSTLIVNDPNDDEADASPEPDLVP